MLRRLPIQAGATLLAMALGGGLAACSAAAAPGSGAATPPGGAPPVPPPPNATTAGAERVVTVSPQGQVPRSAIPPVPAGVVGRQGLTAFQATINQPLLQVGIAVVDQSNGAAHRMYAVDAGPKLAWAIPGPNSSVTTKLISDPTSVPVTCTVAAAEAICRPAGGGVFKPGTSFDFAPDYYSNQAASPRRAIMIDAVAVGGKHVRGLASGSSWSEGISH